MCDYLRSENSYRTVTLSNCVILIHLLPARRLCLLIIFFNLIILLLYVNEEVHKEKGTGLLPWPKRLTAPPPRLEEIGVTLEEFHKDTVSL